MSTAGKSEYARVLGPYHFPNRVHTKINTNKKLRYREGPRDVLCQLKSCQLPRCFHFQNGSCSPLWILKLHQRTKLRKDWSNRCGDITIFVIFNMAAAAMLDFQKNW